jgi:hypothetical protein
MVSVVQFRPWAPSRFPPRQQVGRARRGLRRACARVTHKSAPAPQAGPQHPAGPPCLEGNGGRDRSAPAPAPAGARQEAVFPESLEKAGLAVRAVSNALLHPVLALNGPILAAALLAAGCRGSLPSAAGPAFAEVDLPPRVRADRRCWRAAESCGPHSGLLSCYISSNPPGE